jgi:hypothetical protein
MRPRPCMLCGAMKHANYPMKYTICDSCEDQIQKLAGEAPIDVKVVKRRKPGTVTIDFGGGANEQNEQRNGREVR